MPSWLCRHFSLPKTGNRRSVESTSSSVKSTLTIAWKTKAGRYICSPHVFLKRSFITTFCRIPSATTCHWTSTSWRHRERRKGLALAREVTGVCTLTMRKSWPHRPMSSERRRAFLSSPLQASCLPGTHILHTHLTLHTPHTHPHPPHTFSPSTLACYDVLFLIPTGAPLPPLHTTLWASVESWHSGKASLAIFCRAPQMQHSSVSPSTCPNWLEACPILCLAVHPDLLPQVSVSLLFVSFPWATWCHPLLRR